MKFIFVLLLSFIQLLTNVSCAGSQANERPGNSTNDVPSLILSSLSCEGSGKWEFGTKDMGPKSKITAPFISDTIPTDITCDFAPGERAKIVKDTMNALKNDRNGIGIFLMGPPGCGKSSTIKNILEGHSLRMEQVVFISPDEAREQISAFKNLTHIPSTLCPGKFRAYSGATIKCLQSGRDIRDDLWAEVLPDKNSFIFDSTCIDSDYCQNQMTAAVASGFTVHLYATYAAKDKCLSRAKDRALKNGRFAEPSYLSHTYDSIKATKAFTALANVAVNSGGEALIFDNDTDSQPAQEAFKYTLANPSCNKAACTFFGLK